MIEKEKAIAAAMSRDCSCINGKDRDNNYKEVIDNVYLSFKEDLKLFSETHRELMNDKDKEIRHLKELLANNSDCM